MLVLSKKTYLNRAYVCEKWDEKTSLLIYFTINYSLITTTICYSIFYIVLQFWVKFLYVYNIIVALSLMEKEYIWFSSE